VHARAQSIFRAKAKCAEMCGESPLTRCRALQDCGTPPQATIRALPEVRRPVPKSQPFTHFWAAISLRRVPERPERRPQVWYASCTP